MSDMFCPGTFCPVYFVLYVLSGYILSGIYILSCMYCLDIFCLVYIFWGIFSSGILCQGIFSPGIFCPVTHHVPDVIIVLELSLQSPYRCAARLVWLAFVINLPCMPTSPRLRHRIRRSSSHACYQSTVCPPHLDRIIVSECRKPPSYLCANASKFSPRPAGGATLSSLVVPGSETPQ